MAFLVRGALIEYGTDFLGPIPNVVIFQFNPESLSRTIQIPGDRASGNKESKESSQVGSFPIEKISLTAHFSAADQLNEDNKLARMFGVGHQLAGLEKMVYPSGGLISSAIGSTIDAIADAIGGAEDESPSTPIPRQKYPRILFIWGSTRILPVIIESMSITERAV